MEKNCKWHFADRDARDQIVGPNNSTTENFRRGEQYQSLIREVIQNSLDARVSFHEPVTVKFSFRRLSTTEFPNLFNLEETLEACRAFFSENGQAQKLYTSMLQTLSQNKQSGSIDCLCIQDEGTIGMNYVPEEQDSTHNSRFAAFMRALGIHSEQASGSGGSFGFGKAAYFGLSPFSIVLASTCSKNNDYDYNYYFEGTAWLSSHSYQQNDGKKQVKSNVGYYDNNDGEPTSNREAIPEFFRREEKQLGTSFFILGASAGDNNQRNEIYNTILESVIENFWLAIIRGELKVIIGSGASAFSVTNDSLTDLVTPSSDTHKLITAYLHPDFHKTYNLSNAAGSIDIYIKKDPAGLNKFQRQRRLLMKVNNVAGSGKDGYNAVTIVSEGNANKILQTTEPPTHDDWNETRLQRYSDERKIARELIREIKGLEELSIADLFDYASRNKGRIRDLNKYCAIRDERTKLEEGNGEQPGDTLTTDALNNLNVKSKKGTKGQALKMITIKTEPNSGGRYRGGSSKTNKAHRENKGGHKIPGNTDGGFKRDETGKERRLYDPKNVKVHCVAQKNDTGYIHILKLTCKKEELHNASFRIKIVGANSNENLTIKSTNVGQINKTLPNIIENVDLQKGLNSIEIQFEDSSKKFAISLDVFH